MEPQQKAALDRAEKAGYLPRIREIAQSATAPIWWSRNSSTIGSAILNNGTMCAVNTGERTICVTAGHVYSKYLLDRNKFDDIECQVGNVRVKLEDYLIDHNEEIDLATFHISPILLAGSGISGHGALKWPPDQLCETDVVVLGGYPGMLRQERSGQVSLPFLSFLARVAQTSSDHSAIQLNLEASYWPDGSSALSPGSDFGGMSGGPLFRYHSTPLEHLQIAGFIYEASTPYELIFARHASCVGSSGHITPGA